jgi:hypothetical protein
MAAKIRLQDGRELTVQLSGKRAAEALEKTMREEGVFVQFNTTSKMRVWVNPLHVSAVEDRPDLEASAIP